MATRVPIELGEWYHCYNRGVDKRRVFETALDYERFILQMYVANGSQSVHLSNLKNKKLSDVLSDVSLDRGGQIVEIGAYCLLPNHFHILLKEIREGGIALFNQKLITGYTMYFNIKQERTGSLFSGTYKSKHVADDRYLKHLISYIHFNPVELIEPKWKEGHGNIKTIEAFLRDYSYSSLAAFRDQNSITRKIVGNSVFDLYDKIPTVKEMLKEAQSYYIETNIKVKP